MTLSDWSPVTDSDVTAGDSLEAAVRAAVEAAPVRPQDAGAVALVYRYAALIDEATPTSVYARHVRNVARALDQADEDAVESMRKIEDALGAHSVASDLGPKLLAALTALGLTLAGRGAGGKVGGPGVGTGSAKLDELRARRDRRPG